MNLTEFKSQQLIGATDILGSYSVMRFCKPSQRSLITNVIVDVFNDEVFRTKEKPDPGVFAAKVKAEISKQEEKLNVGFIPVFIIQMILGFIIQKILEWLWNNYTSTQIDV